jgi:hypothetical protein
MELCLQKTDLSELVKHVIDILSINLKETIVDIRIPRPYPMFDVTGFKLGKCLVI